MTGVIGVVVFAVGLLLSVVLHEAGHFLTAKHYGHKATRFFVGFGPTLWSFRRGETEYGVKAIPAGGFVKIVGMTPLEEVDPGDEDRVFYKQPAREKVVVLAAGSIVHFVIAAVLTFLVLATVGDLTHDVETTTVASVSTCVPLDVNATACGGGDPKAPAASVLRAGDRITAVDSTPVSTFDQVRALIQASPGRPVTLTVTRAGSSRTVSVTPVAVRQGAASIGKIGVSPTAEPAPVSVAGAVPKTFSTLWEYVVETGQGIGSLPSTVAGVFEGKPRNVNGAASVVDIGHVSYQIGNAHGVPLSEKVATWIVILASLNLFVGIFNLLPLLPLDGGHVAIVAYEEARRRVYRWLHRPDPGRVDMLKVMPLTYTVVALFVGLSLVLLYAGITNPISIQ